MQAVGGLRVFAVIVPVLVAAACTGSDATPNLSPVSSAPLSSSAASSSASAAPTVSPLYPADVPLTGHNVRPGETPPIYPAAAQAHTQAGANAFAEFFLRTWDWAYATTNPSYMRHYFGSTCGLCTGIATGISKTAAEHHRYEGGRFVIHSVQTTAIAPVTAPAEFCAKAYIDAGAQTVIDGNGKILTGEPPHANVAFKLCMQSTTSSWHITYWARA